MPLSIRHFARQVSLILFALLAQRTLLADAGVFAGNGQNLHQITSKTIQLVSIDVMIVPGRGPFLFDGGVAGMDRADYQCKFVLRNLSDALEEIQVGFPIDSQFAGQDQAKTQEETAAISDAWVNDYSFLARDATDTYHVSYVHRTPKAGPGEFASLFLWTMHFDAKQTRTLTVTYHIPISMGLVSTAKDPKTAYSNDGVFESEQVDLAMMERVGYITSTGSSWAGKVEKAKFTVITDPFERYLSQRGVIEEAPEDGAKRGPDTPNPFPAHHPFWFRHIDTPNGTPVEGGLEWSYTDYKPQDTIVVSYYFTVLPQRPDEVDAFLDAFLARLRPGQQTSNTLANL